MYKWKNSKINSQYELQKMMAKNNGVSPFTEEELSVSHLKTKNFSSIHDPQIKRLVELAYIRGTLNGLQTADMQLEESSMEDSSNKKSSTVIITKQVEVQKTVNEERLYFIVCKIKNRQDKVTYVNLTLKARNDADAESMAASECSLKHQTLLKCKIVKSYATDTMQFQFGIGNKEQTTLAALGKKMLL